MACVWEGYMYRYLTMAYVCEGYMYRYLTLSLALKPRHGLVIAWKLMVHNSNDFCINI